MAFLDAALFMASKYLMNIRSVSLIVLSVQTSAMVLLLRYSRTAHTQHYIISTAVLLSEILKTVLSLTFLLVETGGMLSLIDRLLKDIIFNVKETVKLVIPAGLYVIQNNLLFVALTNLDAATYQVTYQLKILTTAIFSWIMLGKRLSVLQWCSLALLMIGVSLVQIEETIPADSPVASITQEDNFSAEIELEKEFESRLDAADPNHEVSWLLGVFAVFISCLSSGFSGVYFERLVKKGRNMSLFVRNIQLGLFSIIFSFMAIYGDSRLISEGGFFQGYTCSTWIVIVIQALGGLIVAVTMKYADNILKGFATSLSIVMSSFVSWSLLGDPAPTLQFLFGASIVIGATFLYGAASRGPDSTSSQNSGIQVKKTVDVI